MLSENDAAVWWLDVDTVNAGDWPRLEAVLEDSEKARAARFHFERDRLTYIAAHALGRLMLSAHAGGDPAAWRFTTGDHGKPEVICENGPALRLNLSHTRGLAAAGLTLEHDIGVDVEWLDRKPAALDLAARFFAPSECAYLESVAPERVHETFLTFWTLKEAYVKAIGKGLAQPLDSFFFTLDPLSIGFDSALADDPERWLFRRLSPSERHLMALALRHPRPADVRVSALAMDAQTLLQGRKAK